jgi:hypothetical protein
MMQLIKMVAPRQTSSSKTSLGNSVNEWKESQRSSWSTLIINYFRLFLLFAVATSSLVIISSSSPFGYFMKRQSSFQTPDPWTVVKKKKEQRKQCHHFQNIPEYHLVFPLLRFQSRQSTDFDILCL